MCHMPHARVLVTQRENPLPSIPDSKEDSEPQPPHQATNNVSHAVSSAPSRGVGGGKRKQSKGPTRVAGKGIGGELGRIYMAAPKDKSGASARAAPSGDPRVRRFVPTSATAAVAASAEDAGTFAPLVDQMDRTPVLHDLSGAGERMSIND